MLKRILSLFLCLFFLMTMALPAYADESETTVETDESIVFEVLTIKTTEEFLIFAEKCRLDSYSRNLIVSLEGDIDLTGHDFSGIPIFSGIFQGQGHGITGLNLTADGSAQGLFRYLTATATVQDLTVQGLIQLGGSKNMVGGIAGHNDGRILNCSFSGTLSGNDSVGGIAGTNTVTGIIENCRAEGEIHGNHFTGGIAGENSGVIRGCENHAPVNTTPQQNQVEISDITMDTLTNTETVNTVTDIGGIAGISSGVIRSCTNHADVGYQHMGYNIGGIAGTQSGYISECRNHGNIQGRKEVGGIVGQMEPVSIIEYSEDTLQILRGQLNDMSGLVNQASGNAQANAGEITAQIGVLQEQTQTATDALDVLFPDPEDPEIPDADTILAAQNTLSATMDAMPGTLSAIFSATQNTIQGLTRDLNAISAQVGAMGQTLNNASETLGGTITDISDLDTPELLSAKVESCENFGSILADLNAGGIAGAMAIETDLDILEDWLLDGESSLNFQAEVRAVILNSQNHGTITGTRQNVGGITGWQSLGLIKNSANTGTIQGSNASYSGGITGMGSGYIRNCYAKCQIQGKTYVGGIAGTGTIVTDSIAQVRILDARETQGAILGYAKHPGADVENPISGNIYLWVDADPGAIDGISYSGAAEPMDLVSFLAQEDLPELFKTVTIRFVFDETQTAEIKLTPGSSLPMNRIPQIPAKDGFTGSWEGLHTTNLDNIVFDMTFTLHYTPHSTAIQSEATRENGLPLVLVEGAFPGDSSVTVMESNTTVDTASNFTLLEVWQIRVPSGASAVRFLCPSSVDTGKLKLLFLSQEGLWEDVPFIQDGSYLVFPVTPEEFQIALVLETNQIPIWLFASIVAVLISAAFHALCRKKKGSQPRRNG